MGIRLIFLNLRQMRWGDGAWKIIRVLEVPVVERRRSAGNPQTHLQGKDTCRYGGEVIGSASKKSL